MGTTRIVAVFPGMGLTHLYMNQNRYKMCSKILIVSDESTVKKYVDDIENSLKINESMDPEHKYDILFISSRESVRKEMEKRQIHYFLVYPYYNDKYYYLAQYKKENNSNKFINNMADNYYNYIESMDKEKWAWKVKLRTDIKLSEDLLDEFHEPTKLDMNDQMVYYNNKYNFIDWTYSLQRCKIRGKAYNYAYQDWDTICMYQEIPEKIVKSEAVKPFLVYDYVIKYGKIYRKEFRKYLKEIRKGLKL